MRKHITQPRPTVRLDHLKREDKILFSIAGIFCLFVIYIINLLNSILASFDTQFQQSQSLSMIEGAFKEHEERKETKSQFEIELEKFDRDFQAMREKQNADFQAAEENFKRNFKKAHETFDRNFRNAISTPLKRKK